MCVSYVKSAHAQWPECDAFRPSSRLYVFAGNGPSIDTKCENIGFDISRIIVVKALLDCFLTNVTADNFLPYS